MFLYFYGESKEALNKWPCIFCSEEHHIPSQCKKITKSHEKKSRTKSTKRNLSKGNICFIYLKRRHVFTNCRSSFICKKCFGKHRISLCSRNQITQQDETVTAHFRIFNDSLLQIAQAKISNVKGKDFLTISLLFDSGSQRTYNTDNLRKLLHLETVRTENIVEILRQGSFYFHWDNSFPSNLFAFEKKGKRICKK